MTFLGNVDKLSVSIGDNRVVVANSAAIAFAGSYGDIINFLAKLTNRTQKVLIRSLPETQGWPGICSFPQLGFP